MEKPEPAKTKVTKLVQLEERYKALFRDKKVIDSYFKSILTNDAYELYAATELGKMTLAMLQEWSNAKKTYEDKEATADIFQTHHICKLIKDSSEYDALIAAINNKLIQCKEEINSKNEELSVLRKKDEQKITDEAKILLNKLKSGTEQKDELDKKYNSLLIECNALKMELQKKSKLTSVRLIREMISENTSTDKIIESPVKYPMPSLPNYQSEYKNILKEYSSCKDKAHQMLVEKDKIINNLRNEVKDALNKSKKVESEVGKGNSFALNELSRGNSYVGNDPSRGNSFVLNEKALAKFDKEEEVYNLKSQLEMHIKSERDLAEKIRNLTSATKEAVNLEYIKNIFLKYQLYQKCGRNVETKMMLGILYDIFHVSPEEKDEIEKGKTGGVIWKAVKSANIDILSNVISGKPISKAPTPYTRKVVKSVGDSCSRVNTKEEEEEHKAPFYK